MFCEIYTSKTALSQCFNIFVLNQNTFLIKIFALWNVNDFVFLNVFEILLEYLDAVFIKRPQTGMSNRRNMQGFVYQFQDFLETLVTPNLFLSTNLRVLIQYQLYVYFVLLVVSVHSNYFYNLDSIFIQFYYFYLF